MAEGPTAPPEPVAWGTESNPFPVGTRIRVPNPEVPGGEVRTVDGHQEPNIVFVDGMGIMEKELQGWINEEGWEIVDSG